MGVVSSIEFFWSNMADPAICRKPGRGTLRKTKIAVFFPYCVFPRAVAIGAWRCSRARALPHYKWRADTFKRVAETGPRLANAVGKGRLSLTDFLPEVEK